MKPRKLSGLSMSIQVSSSFRYSSMFMNQQFLRLMRSRFTSLTKMGYWPTGPTGQMNTVFSPAALCSLMVLTISSASS